MAHSLWDGSRVVSFQLSLLPDESNQSFIVAAHPKRATVGNDGQSERHLLTTRHYHSCPDDDLCRRVHFSGAITCDHYITWQKHQSDPETTVCESVFPEDEI